MEQSSPKILFLYAHVQPFLLAGIKSLVNSFNAKVKVVVWPAPDITPLQLPADDIIDFIVKKEDNIKNIGHIIFDFDPDIIYSVGWMDQDYLKWAAMFKKRGKPVIMSMDNQWKGTIRQRINTIIAPMRLHRSYTHAWVPGYPQYEYARRLGFKPTHILKGLYSAIEDIYRDVHKEKTYNQVSYPHTFLYAGRLVAHKFGKLLEAFTTLDSSQRRGWKLIVAGDGPLKHDPAFDNEGIDHRGFLQPNDLAALACEGGVFCLLSDEEPWGTVIEEFANAGMPLLLSQNCGAHYSFLVDGYNGLLVRENSVREIKNALLQMIDLPNETLMTMGERSFGLSCPNTADIWAATLMSVHHNKLS